MATGHGNIYAQLAKLDADINGSSTFTVNEDRLVGGAQLASHASDSGFIAACQSGTYDVVFVQGGSGDTGASYGADLQPIANACASSNTPLVVWLWWAHRDTPSNYATVAANIRAGAASAGTSAGITIQVLEMGDAWDDLRVNQGIADNYLYYDNTHQNGLGGYVNALSMYRFLTGEAVTGVTYNDPVYPVTFAAGDEAKFQTAVDTFITQSLSGAPVTPNTASIQILTPADGAVFNEGDTITFTATASDTGVGLSVTKPTNLQAGVESANVVATNASADNLLQAAFNATLDSVDISSYITSFVNDGSNQYTLAFTLPVSFPRQFNATGYDLVVTENSIASTQTEVPYVEPAAKDYVNLTAGFVAVKLWETGEAVAAGDERMVGNDILSHAAGLGSSTTTPADGVDGWAFERPSSSVADGWTGTALTVGAQAVFDIADGYTVNADGTWDFDQSAANDVVIDIYFIATDGTISPTSTYTYVLPSTEDLIPPTISISANGNTVSFTISESVADFVVGDISVDVGTLTNLTGSGQSYTATFVPPTNSNGTATVSVAVGTITDAAGNANTAGDSTTIAYDTRPQTLVFPTTAGDEVTDKQGNLLANTEFYFHVIALDLSVTENVSGTTDASGYFPTLNLSTVPIGTDVQIIPYSNVNRDFGIPPILATVGVAI